MIDEKKRSYRTGLYNSNPSSYRYAGLKDIVQLLDGIEKDARQFIDPECTVGLDISTTRGPGGDSYRLFCTFLVLIRNEKLRARKGIWLRPSDMWAISDSFPKELPFHMSHLIDTAYVNECFRFEWPENKFLTTFNSGTWACAVPWSRIDEWDASSLIGQCIVDLKNELLRSGRRTPVPIPDGLINDYQVMRELTQRVNDLFFGVYESDGAGTITNYAGKDGTWNMSYSPYKPLFELHDGSFKHWMEALTYLIESLWSAFRRQSADYYTPRSYRLNGDTVTAKDRADIYIEILDGADDEEP